MSQTASETESLYSSLDGDPDLGRIVSLFVEEMPNRIVTLLAQLEASDREGLRRTAHQLKGAAGSYGFDVISPCAAQLEDTIRQGGPEEEIHAGVGKLVDLCGRVRGRIPSF